MNGLTDINEYNNINQSKNFTMLQNEFVRAPDLDPYEFRLYVYLSSFNPCYPSHTKMEKDTGMSRKTISNLILRLEKKGYLTKKSGIGRRHNTYTMHQPKLNNTEKPNNEKPKVTQKLKNKSTENNRNGSEQCESCGSIFESQLTLSDSSVVTDTTQTNTHQNYDAPCVVTDTILSVVTDTTLYNKTNYNNINIEAAAQCSDLHSNNVAPPPPPQVKNKKLENEINKWDCPEFQKEWARKTLGILNIQIVDHWIGKYTLPFFSDCALSFTKYFCEQTLGENFQPAYRLEKWVQRELDIVKEKGQQLPETFRPKYPEKFIESLESLKKEGTRLYKRVTGDPKLMQEYYAEYQKQQRKGKLNV